MAKQTIAYLKGKFQTGAKPTQQDYYDLLDSLAHIDNVTELEETAVEARLEEYNNELRSVTPGVIDTLGDILKVFEGFPDVGNVKQMIDNAGGAPSWSIIGNRPEKVEVTWEEVTIQIFGKWTPQFTIGQSQESMTTKMLVSGVGELPASVKWVIKDIEVHAFPVQQWQSSAIRVAHAITNIVICKTPQINLKTA